MEPLRPVSESCTSPLKLTVSRFVTESYEPQRTWSDCHDNHKDFVSTPPSAKGSPRTPSDVGPNTQPGSSATLAALNGTPYKRSRHLELLASTSSSPSAKRHFAESNRASLSLNSMKP